MAEIRKQIITKRIVRLARHALAEYRDPFALTDALRARSTSRRKTRAERAADKARLDALCECLYVLRWRDARTPADVRQCLEAASEEWKL